jgi:hypothetical protein
MYFKTILTLLVCLIFQLKYVENQSCLNLQNWRDFKSKFKLTYTDTNQEITAYKIWIKTEIFIF